LFTINIGFEVLFFNRRSNPRGREGVFQGFRKKEKEGFPEEKLGHSIRKPAKKSNSVEPKEI